MEWVFVLLGGMAMAVVLGHFGWVLVARIFGYQVKTLRAGKAAGRPCPRCRSGALTPQGMCMLCGYSNRAPATPTIDSDGLTRTAGYLTRFRNAGLIDTDTYAKVYAAIRAEQKRSAMQGLMHGAPQPQSPPLPPPLPPLPVLPVEEESGEPPQFDDRGFPLESPVLPEHSESVPPVLADSVFEPAPGIPSAPEITTPPRLPVPPRPPVTPAAPPKPRRPLSEVFAAFMEEKNIRWGELVGGLLIVGCSVALVISFWGQIQALPWLQFSVFTAVTAGLFGLGLYTEHRWKLPTTSRGILVIATLLVPLNFLAFAAFTKGGPPGVLTLGAELVAFALFGWLVWQAGKVIAPFWPEMLTTGVCGLCASLLALRYAAGIPQLSAAQLYSFAVLPIGCYGAVSAWMLRRARQWKTIHAPGANAIFLLLGVLSFGTILAVGLLVSLSHDPLFALRRLAPLISLAGVPALASGLLIWQRVTAASLAKVRTAGTAVAIAGAGILLAGLALAWPDPAGMLPVAVCDFLVLTALALLYDIPAAHFLALPCLVLAWLLGFHLMRGNLPWTTGDPRQTLDALLKPIGGAVLVPLVLLLACGREWFIRRGKSAHGRAYGTVGIVVAALSVGMVTWGGFAKLGDPLGATWVYLAYSAIAFVLAWRTARVDAAWAGWGMLLAGAAQGFISHRITRDPLSAGLLSGAAIATFTNALATRFGEKGKRLLGATGRWIAIGGAGAAAAVALAGVSYSAAGRVSATVSIAAAIWFAVAFIESVPGLFMAAQALLAGGLVLAVTSRLTGRVWFQESNAPLLDPLTIQAQGLALALFCLAWTIFRLVLKSVSANAGPPGSAAHDGNDAGASSVRNRLVRLVDSPWPLDRGLSAVLLLALLGLSLAGVGPAIVAELSRATAGNAPVGLDSQASRAIGAGSWWLLATLITVFAGAWLEALRLHSTVGSPSAKPLEGARPVNRAGVAFAVLALLITLWAACPLLAAREAGMGASAAAMRWLAAFFILLGSVPLWLRQRLPRSLGLRGNEGDAGDRTFTQLVRGTLDILGILPVLVLTGYPAIAALSGEPITGPSSASFFARIGPSLSYAIPLLVVAMVLVGNAIRERSPGHAFAASLVLCFTATLAYLLSLTTSREPLSMVRLFQINSLTMSGFALAWLAARTIAGALGRDSGRIPGPLKVQVKIGLGLSMLVVFAAGLLIVLSPSLAGPFIMDAGGGSGWAALVAAISAAVWLESLQRDRPTFRTLGLCGLALAMMEGLSLVSNSRRGWLGYHAMLAANTLLAWAMLGIGWWLIRQARSGAAVVFWPASAGAAATNPLVTGTPPAGGATVLSYQRPASSTAPTIVAGAEMVHREATRWAFGIGMFAVALGIRALAGDPAAPWWSMGAALAVALLATTIACWGSRPAFLYAAGLLLNLTAWMWFVCRGTTLGGDGFLNLLCVQAIAAALPGVAWLVLELQVFRPSAAVRIRGWPPYHHVAAIGAGLICAAVATLMLTGQVAGHGAMPDPIVMWLAMLAAAGLFAASTSDPTAHYAMPGLYVMGLTAISAGLALAARGDWLVWRAGIALGIYTLATAAIWNQRIRIREILRGLGMAGEPADPDSKTSLAWLAPANLCVALAVLAIALWSDFTFPPVWARLLTAAVAILQAPMLALLTERNRPSSLRPAALITLCAAAVALGWAWMDPHGLLPLERLVVVFTTFAVITAFYAAGLSRIFGAGGLWARAARRLTEPLAVVTTICLAGILLLEGFGRAAVPGFHVSTPMMLTVLLVLLAGCAGALIAALQLGEATGLSDRLRVRCVYAAEALLALAFVHLRLTEPQLFGGVFQQYWPLIVMAIAFAGVGAGELFARQQRLILSEPLMRTGIFLPLLPVIGFWLPGPHVHVSFAGLLLTVCVFYAMLAALRRSFTFGLIAAMAANGALWSVLSGMSGWGITQHPQLWLIPAASSVLAAAQLNRDRLTPDALRTLRYGCLLVVYVSSTADVFINGVATAPWLPLVLAGLSVAGVLVGVMFRVRPFLFLGTAFLALSVVTMIYYASSQLHWTWIWYVAGILLGAGIIVLFALFEKKRTEMLALVEGLKQWQ